MNTFRHAAWQRLIHRYRYLTLIRRLLSTKETLLRLRFLLLVIVLGITQVTIFDCLKIVNVKPDLLLFTAVVASLTFDLRSAILLSAAAGFVTDIFGTAALGMHTVLFPFWSYLVIYIARKISTESISIKIALVGIVTALHAVVTGLFSIYPSLSLGIFSRVVCIETLYTTAVAYVLLRYCPFY
jgi:rod shape-determining protein MreD